MEIELKNLVGERIAEPPHRMRLAQAYGWASVECKRNMKISVAYPKRSGNL